METAVLQNSGTQRRKFPAEPLTSLPGPFPNKVSLQKFSFYKRALGQFGQDPRGAVVVLSFLPSLPPMAAPELLLDGSIRFWVLLPVAWIALAVGILRLRVAGLWRGERELGWREQRQDTQILARSRLLRENGRFLTLQGFLMRKHYFNNPESGFFRKTKRKIQPRNPLTDPTMVMEMMKGNIVNVLPMILVGGWINWAFAGFVATKVPFPLTLRFKPMLQRGINLPSLDPSWVSSASWYFLNVFGLRRVYNIVLGEETAAEQNQLLLQDHFMEPALPTPPDPNKAFKAEWEALELVSHHWALRDVEQQLMSEDLNLAGMFGSD